VKSVADTFRSEKKPSAAAKPKIEEFYIRTVRGNSEGAIKIRRASNGQELLTVN
jgi:hypothetical protein